MPMLVWVGQCRQGRRHRAVIQYAADSPGQDGSRLGRSDSKYCLRPSRRNRCPRRCRRTKDGHSHV
eukprot:8870876-Pyramimonas_sp.AAC.1